LGTIFNDLKNQRLFFTWILACRGKCTTSDRVSPLVGHVEHVSCLSKPKTVGSKLKGISLRKKFGRACFEIVHALDVFLLRNSVPSDREKTGLEAKKFMPDM